MSTEHPHTDDASADRAITTRGADALNRKTFANNVAKAISQRKGRESFVISLQGPWGCGKSSIKNMVLDALREDYAEDEQPIIIEFEPWQYRDADALFDAFFDEIIGAVAPELRDAQKNIERLERFKKKITLASFAVKFLGGVASLKVGPAAAAAAAPIAGILDRSAEQAGEEKNALGKLEEDESLQDLKGKLRKAMLEMKRPVLVVVDEIDRLDAEETARVFQLVKANADFPNFTYLLAFESKIVEKNLEKITAGSGREYLEKIIQKPISVPGIRQSQINNALFKGIEKLHDASNIPFDENERWQHEDWLANGLGDFIRSLRDVHRVTNALDFALPLFISDGSVEVNIPDLVALETLRIHEPDVYALLAAYKPVLLNTSMFNKVADRITSRYGPQSSQPDGPSSDEVVLQSLVDTATQKNRVAVRHILERLFPDAEWPKPLPEGMVKWPKREGHAVDLQSRLRVREATYFDRYFLFGLDEGDLSEAEVTDFLRSVGDGNAALAKLMLLVNRKLIDIFLTRLRSRIKDIPPQDAPQLLRTLLQFGEQLLQGQSVQSRNDSIQRVEDVIYGVVADSPQRQEAYQWLLNAFESVDGVWLPSILLFRSHHSGHHYDFLADEPTMTSCEEIVRQRIADGAAQGRFDTHPELPTLLQLWAEGAYTTGDANAAQNWVRNYIRRPENLVHLLRGLTDWRGQAVDGVATVFLQSSVEGQVKTLPMPDMVNRMRAAQGEGLTDEQRKYVDVFLPIFESF